MDMFVLAKMDLSLLVAIQLNTLSACGSYFSLQKGVGCLASQHPCCLCDLLCPWHYFKMSSFSVPSTAPIIFPFYTVVTPGGTSCKDGNRWRQFYAWKTSSLQTLLDMPPNNFIAGRLANIASSAHLIFFKICSTSIACMNCLLQTSCPCVVTDSLRAAESRGFGIASNTGLTCSLLCLMAGGDCISLSQLCVVIIPFPPWHSSKEAFATW